MKPWALLYALMSIGFAVYGSGADDDAKALVSVIFWSFAAFLAFKAQGGPRW